MYTTPRPETTTADSPQVRQYPREEAHLLKTLDRVLDENLEYCLATIVLEQPLVQDLLLAGKLPYDSEKPYDVVISRRNFGRGASTENSSEIEISGNTLYVTQSKISSPELGYPLDGVVLCGLSTWIAQAEYSLDLSQLVKTERLRVA